MRSAAEQVYETRQSAHHSGCVRLRSIRVFMMDLLSVVPYYDGHLCAALNDDDGLEVTLGAITYHYDQSYFCQQGVRIRPGLDVVARLPLSATLLRPLKALESTINLAMLAVRLAAGRPDILHVQFLPLMEVGIPFERWVLRVARALGIRIIHTVHNLLPPDAAGRMAVKRHELMYRDIYRSADALICHDERAKARLIAQFGVRPKRVRVIPHGPLFQNACRVTRCEARSRVKLDADECVVLWQGILEPYKGVSFLLKAWRQVEAGQRKVRLAIVGSGRNGIRQSIKNEVTRLRINSSVRLELRFVTVEELAYWYQASDVLVYPYSESTTSGALMTGINYGKAIVATKMPGFQQMLRHGDNALLVDYGDVDGLACELRRLISDEQLRLQLGERIQKLRSAGPTWAAIARQTRQCYEAVLTQGAQGPERP